MQVEAPQPAIALVEPIALDRAPGWRRNYFQVVSVCILALVLTAFSDNLLTDVGQESNTQLVFVIHGLFALAWVILFAVQSFLVRSSRVGVHRKLGLVVAGVAFGVVLTTVFLFVQVWEGWNSMPFNVKANRMFLPAYACAVGLAIYWRRKPHLHKRLILIASLYMLSPVMDRASDHLGIDVYAFNIVVWNALWLSLFVYDKVTTRRVQPITWTGFLTFYLVWLASIVF